MRRILLLTAFVAVLTTSAALAKASFPDVIALPNGWQPEGIAILEIGHDPRGLRRALERSRQATGQVD